MGTQTCTCPPRLLQPDTEIDPCYIEQASYYLYICPVSTTTPYEPIVCTEQKPVHRLQVDPCGTCKNGRWIPYDGKTNTNCAPCVGIPAGWGLPGQATPNLDVIKADLLRRRSPGGSGASIYYRKIAAWGESTCDSSKCEKCTPTKRGGSTYACQDHCQKKNENLKNILENGDEDTKERHKGDLGCVWACQQGSEFGNTKTGCEKKCEDCLPCQSVKQKRDPKTGLLIQECIDACPAGTRCSIETKSCKCYISLADCLPPSEIKQRDDGGCECYTPPESLSLDLIP